MAASSIGPILPVECGRNRGQLYLRDMAMAIRDQGRVGREPCVAFHNEWMSPNQFVVTSKGGQFGTWDKTVKHHGVPLRELMEEGTVTLEPPECHCDHCEWEADIEEAHRNNQVVEVSAVYLCEDCDVTYENKREFLLHKKSDHPTQFKSYAGKLRVELEKSCSAQPSPHRPPQPTSRHGAPQRKSPILKAAPLRSTTPQPPKRQISSPEVPRRASTSVLKVASKKGGPTKKIPTGTPSVAQKRKTDTAKAKEDEAPAPHKTPKHVDKTPPPRHNPFAGAKTEDILAELKRRNSTFPCECGILFTDRALYYLHKGMHSPKDPKKCSFCGYIAQNWPDFNSHFFDHGNPHKADEA